MKHSLLLLLSLLNSTLVFAVGQEHDSRDVRVINGFESSDITKLGYISVLQNDGSRIECSGAIVGHKHVLAKASCFDISGVSSREDFKKNGGFLSRVFAKGSDVSFVTGYFGSVGPGSKIYKAKAVKVIPDYQKHQIICSGGGMYGAGFTSCTDLSDFYNVALLEFEDHTFTSHFDLMDEEAFKKTKEGIIILYGYRNRAETGDLHLWSDSVSYDTNAHKFLSQSLEYSLNAPTMADAYGAIVLYQDGRDNKIIGIQTGAVSQMTGLFQSEMRPSVTYIWGSINKWLKATIAK